MIKKNSSQNPQKPQNCAITQIVQDEDLIIQKYTWDQAETFFRRNETLMLGMATKMLKNSNDAEDAVAGTFTQFYKNFDKLREHKYIKSFLFKILQNECLNVFRQRRMKKIQCTELHEEIIDAKSEEQFLEMEKIEKIAALSNLIANLSEEHQLILRLYIGERYTDSQIAKLLNLADSTVRSRRHRALYLLRQMHPKKKATKVKLPKGATASTIVHS